MSASAARHETRALLRAHLAAASAYGHLTRHCAVCHRLLRLAMEPGAATEPGGASEPAPDPTGAAPDATEAAPDATGAAPDPTGAAPDATEAAPDATEAAPDATGAAPDPAGASAAREGVRGRPGGHEDQRPPATRPSAG
ncbi:DUF6274 family protein [Streptomyces sp. NPDC007117]|uniref:DUF6274 family protein n=1 Tax=Streptomyces sp. NPDC007117 TaxID=3154314 RepID=UPI0033F68B8E